MTIDDGANHWHLKVIFTVFSSILYVTFYDSEQLNSELCDLGCYSKMLQTNICGHMLFLIAVRISTFSKRQWMWKFDVQQNVANYCERYSKNDKRFGGKADAYVHRRGESEPAATLKDQRCRRFARLAIGNDSVPLQLRLHITLVDHSKSHLSMKNHPRCGPFYNFTLREISLVRLMLDTSNFVHELTIWSQLVNYTYNGGEPPSWRDRVDVTHFYILDLENFATSGPRIDVVSKTRWRSAGELHLQR